jgi:AcrR family transcriptional regulator
MRNPTDPEITRKGEILNAARRCFARHGFAKTTLDDIAQAVRMKAGSLYHYYDGKEAIFRDVITCEGKEMLGWLKGEVAKEKSATKKVLRYTKARLERFRKVTNLLDVSIQVVVEVAPLVNKLYQEYLNREIVFLADIIGKGVKAGNFKQCNSRRIASAILAISESVKYQAFQAANTVAASEVDYTAVDTEVSYVTKLILAGITNE